MTYAAATIDTNIVTKNAYNLEGGLLARLFQFNDANVSFVLSDIVVREIHRHIHESAKEVRTKLEGVAGKYLTFGLLEAEEIATIRDIAARAIDTKIATQMRVERFIQRTGATVVKPEEAGMKDLVRLYFDARPPFEPAGKKKNEFPDAIALLSLEAWGRSNGKKILAISDDKGWHDFALKSEWIDAEPDLARALQILQKDAAEALEIATALIAEIADGERDGFKEMIEECLRSDIGSRSYYGEAEAAYRAETDYVEGVFESFDFAGDKESGFTIDVVEFSENDITASVKLEVAAKFEADFNLFTYDSVDREDVNMGATKAEVSQVFDVSVLMTFSGNFAILDQVNMTEVEVIDMIDSVDFGYVEMDHSEIYDDWADGAADKAADDAPQL